MTSSFNAAPSPRQRDPQQLQAELVSLVVDKTYGKNLTSEQTLEYEERAENLLKTLMSRDPDLLQRYIQNEEKTVNEIKEKLEEMESKRKLAAEDQEDLDEAYEELKM